MSLVLLIDNLEISNVTNGNHDDVDGNFGSAQSYSLLSWQSMMQFYQWNKVEISRSRKAQREKMKKNIEVIEKYEEVIRQLIQTIQNARLKILNLKSILMIESRKTNNATLFFKEFLTNINQSLMKSSHHLPELELLFIFFLWMNCLK